MPAMGMRSKLATVYVAETTINAEELHFCFLYFYGVDGF